MALRGTPTSFAERMTIHELAAHGESDTAIAQTLQRSRWTIRKWRRRSRRFGLAGLQPRRGRPPTGPLGTISSALRDHIRQLRLDHPGWGPQTILLELQRDPVWNTHRLPSRARIGAFLRSLGLTRRYQRHTQVPEPPRVPAPSPHKVWELDAKGVTTITGLGQVSLINIVDVGSRLKVESTPATCWAPSLKDYHLALRRAFLVHGLPAIISFDRGTVFFDNTSPSPFPTRIHLWLIALGIEVQFSRPRRPTDHAMIERTHQTLDAQAVRGQTWSDLLALWQGLDERRHVLNSQYPMRACGQRAPLQAQPAAVHSQRVYRPEWEHDLLDLARVGRYLADAYWYRQASPQGHIGLGGIKYFVGPAIANRGVRITFDATTWEFMLHAAGAEADYRVVPRGLAKADLMGELAGFQQLPTYQLALPWTREAWRTSEYAQLVQQ